MTNFTKELINELQLKYPCSFGFVLDDNSESIHEIITYISDTPLDPNGVFKGGNIIIPISKIVKIFNRDILAQSHLVDYLKENNNIIVKIITTEGEIFDGEFLSIDSSGSLCLINSVTNSPEKILVSNILSAFQVRLNSIDKINV